MRFFSVVRSSSAAVAQHRPLTLTEMSKLEAENKGLKRMIEVSQCIASYDDIWCFVVDTFLDGCKMKYATNSAVV